MNKKAFLALWLATLTLVCSAYLVIAKSNESNGSIKALLDMQAEAWNNGDLKTFMTGYKNSPLITYTSQGKVISGYEALLAHYEKRYGNNADTMGKLDFNILQIVQLGKNNALCIGEWHLLSKDDKEMNGVFSLVLSRDDEKSNWKVIHDHTSLCAK